MALISAISLRQQVTATLREWILAGTLPAGLRLRETALSEQLGVSRTPIREAFLGLEQEGLVCSEANKGFRVSPLDPQEVMDLYPIVAALEATAVRTAGAALQPKCRKLRRINRQIAAGGEPEQLYRLDLSWHELLWRHCGNERLVQLIESLKARIRRFDGAHRRGVADPEGSCRQHEAIIEAIERGDFEYAAAQVDDHWRQGTQTVLEWISADNQKGA